jgi:hypothetical protein
MELPVRFSRDLRLQSARDQVENVILEALDALIELSPAGSGYTYSSATGRLTVTLPNADGITEHIELFFRPGSPA